VLQVGSNILSTANTCTCAGQACLDACMHICLAAILHGSHAPCTYAMFYMVATHGSHAQHPCMAPMHASHPCCKQHDSMPATSIPCMPHFPHIYKCTLVICVHACAQWWVPVNTYACMHVSVSPCMHVIIHVYMNIRPCIRTRTHMSHAHDTHMHV